MDRRELKAGQVIDGFRLIEPLESGGMASFWRVARDGNDLPMVMKIPLLRPGEDPLTIIGYEVEQMILPRLTGPHAPRFSRRRGLRSALHRDGVCRRPVCEIPARQSTTAARRGCGDRRQDCFCPARHPSPARDPSGFKAEQCDPARTTTWCLSILDCHGMTNCLT